MSCIKIKRISDVELRYTLHWRTNKGYFEIVKYYPNYLYNKENDFIYDEQTKMYSAKTDPNFHCTKSSFANKESCFTVGSFTEYDIDKSDEEPDFISVGSRIFDSFKTPEDRAAFEELGNIFYNQFWYEKKSYDEVLEEMGIVEENE